MKNNMLWLFILVLGFSACTKLNDDEPSFPVDAQLGKGFFVINQGNFTSGNASLSFFNEDSLKMTNNLFYRLNGSPLGDVANSIAFWDDEAFLVVNNSAYIYVIDAKTGVFKRRIAELESPRFVQIIDQDKAYISDFQLKGLAVFNPRTMEPLGIITTGKTTEAMVMIDENVFVSNWSNYNQTTQNNTIQVIDIRFDRLVDSIVVAMEPNSMVVDKNRKIWVLCSGGFMNEEIPALFRIDPATRSVERRFNFPTIESSPEQLKINAAADRIYFVNKDIYAMEITDEQLPANPVISAGSHNFFALGLHPVNNTILVSDAGNYVQNGWVFRYHADGILIDSIQAGLIPGYFEFNYKK